MSIRRKGRTIKSGIDKSRTTRGMISGRIAKSRTTGKKITGWIKNRTTGRKITRKITSSNVTCCNASVPYCNNELFLNC